MNFQIVLLHAQVLRVILFQGLYWNHVLQIQIPIAGQIVPVIGLKQI